MSRNHKCSHLDSVIQLSLPELCKIKQGQSCSECDTFGPNLWICLHRNCLHIGCSEQVNDHSTKHFKFNHQHCIHMNLSSQRIWCYLCETEVFLPQQQQRRSSIISNDSSDAGRGSYSSERGMYERAMSSSGGGGGGAGSGPGESPETSGDEEDGDRRLLDGLVGLQNIANTCYMNAALQALSNSPPLTTYFLDCGDIIEATSELTGSQRKIGLAKSYHRLMREMWCRSKRSNGYVVPRGILYGIRSVHPMFRGFQQHDTQEFLRCFMDQLHEELKEVTPPPPDILFKQQQQQHQQQQQQNNAASDNEDNSPCSSPSPSQSEAEYETCDSGVSEQSSLSDEMTSTRRSPSPTANQRYNPYSKSPTSYGSGDTAMTASQNSTGSSPVSGSLTTTPPIPSSSSLSNTNQPNKSPPKAPHRSIISDVFDGKLLSSVQCLTCDRISTREETFQDLSLPIPGKDHLAVLHQSQGMTATILSQPPPPPPPPTVAGVNCTDAVYQVGQDGWIWWLWNWFKSWFWGPSVSLHDCLAAFFSADELKGDNMYSCEKCNKLRNGIKYSRVLALPEMLCIHLKRFRHDLSYSSKISSPVNFPLTGLDMRPYLHKDCKSEIYTYDLTAVICHHGTVGGGHYTSFAKHELTGKWFEFDDQLVTEVLPEVVQNCQAYVLFYRKSNPHMSIIRAEALELADTNPPQASDIRFFVSRQWLSRFNTFAEPGPIDNWALLCPHGGLPPVKAALITRLAVPLPQPLWDFLYKKFGGGPACNHLFECDICRMAAESLTRRQRNELAAFTQYNDEFQYQETPGTIYAISMAWFRQWQMFARGVTQEEPGPINNSIIAASSDTIPIRNVRPGSDYAQINTTLWKFFYGIYGGGPEIILKGGPAEETKMQKEKDSETMDIDLENEVLNAPVAETTWEMESRRTNATVVVPAPAATATTTTNVAQTTTTTGQPIACIRPTKSVSFEDDTQPQSIESDSSKTNDSSRQNMDDSIAEYTNSTSTIHTTRHAGTKRGKHYSGSTSNSTSANNISNMSSGSSNGAGSLPHTELLLLGKKDKRYRGAMKSSGFFGPEGKYYTNSYHPTTQSDNNIPDEIHASQNHTTSATTNFSPTYISRSNPSPNSQTLMQDSQNNATIVACQQKRNVVEEVTPLLHHRRYPSTSSIGSMPIGMPSATAAVTIPSMNAMSPTAATTTMMMSPNINQQSITMAATIPPIIAPLPSSQLITTTIVSSIPPPILQSDCEIRAELSPIVDRKSPMSNRSNSQSNASGSGGGGGGGNSSHKSSHRKKLKSKNNRKFIIPNKNSGDTNASDSG